MNVLIIGGLFLVALLALIGLVLTARGEQKPQSTSTSHTTAPVSSAAGEEAAHGTVQDPSREAPMAPKVTVPVERTLTAQEEVQRFPIPNGQLHELSLELHHLQQQTQELEHRLGNLGSMVEHMEGDDHTGLEEKRADAPFLPH